MKTTTLIAIAVFLLISCQNKQQKETPSEPPEPTTTFQNSTTAAENDSEEIITTALKAFLKGEPGAAQLSESAKADLEESTWPEAQCHVEGGLMSPSDLTNMVIKKVGPNQYKYEGVCPDHGDKFVDYTTITARLAPDGTVWIDHVKWDKELLTSLSDMLKQSSWYDTGYGFKMPDFMIPSGEIFVEDVPATVSYFSFGEICVSVWPLLGAWAVMEYPSVNNYLMPDVQIQSITYNHGSIFSGYTHDGRVWYAKKKVLSKGEVPHVAVLAVIYPKREQAEMKKFIEIVRKWK